ncbi:DVUA0089 family protein [Uliginosibacterium sp. sgz301328]|uniref:DVUA0089 family protein n=1 Tax=Uliginosibacterium sp. sgz301328 TaxID=3243764 RepID=UPI00359E494F
MTTLTTLFRRCLVALALCCAVSGANAAVIVDRIDQYSNSFGIQSGRSVDFWHITSAGGAATFSLQTGSFDSALWLFRDDGSLDLFDYVAFASNTAFGALDALLSTVLNPGSYILAVGTYAWPEIIPTIDLLDGLQFESLLSRVNATALPYQLTISGASVVGLANSVPEPASLALVACALGLLAGRWRRRA